MIKGIIREETIIEVSAKIFSLLSSTLYLLCDCTTRIVPLPNLNWLVHSWSICFTLKSGSCFASVRQSNQIKLFSGLRYAENSLSDSGISLKMYFSRLSQTIPRFSIFYVEFNDLLNREIFELHLASSIPLEGRSASLAELHTGHLNSVIGPSRSKGNSFLKISSHFGHAKVASMFSFLNLCPCNR